MSNKNSFDCYIQPHYTGLQLEKNNNKAEFSKELSVFLTQYPQFANNPQQISMLCYCFDHYVNFDPASRDLTLQEKLKRAGEMANNFMGFCAKV